MEEKVLWSHHIDLETTNDNKSRPHDKNSPNKVSICIVSVGKKYHTKDEHNLFWESLFRAIKYSSENFRISSHFNWMWRQRWNVQQRNVTHNSKVSNSSIIHNNRYECFNWLLNGCNKREFSKCSGDVMFYHEDDIRFERNHKCRFRFADMHHLCDLIWNVNRFI